jgi:ADP-heptose:LPS heptosyltransferase
MWEPITYLKRSVRRIAGATCLWYRYGGIGDHLMLSTVARELKRRGTRNLLVITEYPDLFLHNRDITALAAPGSRRAGAFLRLAGESTLTPAYHDLLIRDDPTGERRNPPPEHLLACLCRAAGMVGPVDLRPYLMPSESERASAAPYHGCIAIQSSGLAGRFPLLNKQWSPERFAEVAAHLIEDHPVVQIGSPDDPPVPWTHDLRGKTPLRRLAAILSHCRLFIGLVGMPMHLARAVDCPAVIVYGGRERPDQSGYVCNENLYTSMHCSPCWLDSRCDFGRACMDSISAPDVIEAAGRMLSRPREGLAIDSYDIT